MVVKALIAAVLLLAPTALAGLPAPGDSPQAEAGQSRVPLALNVTTVDVDGVAAFSIAGYNVSVFWTVSLPANESPANISETAVYFGNSATGPGPLDRADYPSMVPGVLSSGTSYSARLGDIATGGTLYLAFYANVSGADYYNDSEWPIDVRPVPALTQNVGLTDAGVLVGTQANLTVDTGWPYTDELQFLRVVWDIAPHGNNSNATDYPSSEPGSDALDGTHTRTLTPASAGRIYYKFAADLLGFTFTSPVEYSLVVADEPLVTRDSSPPWVLEGSSVTVMWSVLVAGFINYTTELRYDSASHPSPRSALDYPSVAGSFAGSGADSFQATIANPAGPAVFFYLVAYVDGQAFAVTDLSGQRVEFVVAVRPHPVLTLVDAPSFGFVGRNATVEVRVAWGFAESISEVSVHYDTVSQGATPSVPLGYASTTSVSLVQAGWFNFTLSPLSAPGTLYFALHARVGTVDILSAQEFSIPVYAAPAVSVVGPAWVLPSSAFTANVTVTWSQATGVDVRLYSDIESGAPNFDPAQYASFDSQAFTPSGTVGFLVTSPATAGPFYLFAAVVSEGETFTAGAEAVVEVPGAPVIERPQISPRTGLALHGQNVSLTWSVNFAQNTTVSAEFRWDTQSHVSSSGFNFGDYPSSTALVTGYTNSSMGAFFTAPNESTVIYGIVHAVLNGRNYYTAEEVVIQVIPLPLIELLTHPEFVETDQAIPISWRIAFQGDPALIPHTAIHWGLVSKEGLPVTYTNYPGVGGPYRGNATNLFDAELPAQASPGNVYFIVHAVVNDQNFYLSEEKVEVRLPGGATGGGFLPGLEATAAVVAAVAVAVAAGASRRGRRN